MSKGKLTIIIIREFTGIISTILKNMDLCYNLLKVMWLSKNTCIEDEENNKNIN